MEAWNFHPKYNGVYSKTKHLSPWVIGPQVLNNVLQDTTSEPYRDSSLKLCIWKIYRQSWKKELNQ